VTQEQTLGSKPQLGPIETMTYAAACPQRLRLGCAVFVSTLHSPVHLARSISSLDQISRRRIEIGFGTGGKGRLFAAFGVDPERYVARFTEGIEVMTRPWRDPRVDFAGEFWQLADAAMEPKPFQKPYPLLWFGGSGRTALRGAVLSPQPPDQRRAGRALHEAVARDRGCCDSGNSRGLGPPAA
jgi:alkanesulfonate monooxygenase SsuD/methylene tetrahydromethanopterin reductase-like flavin-dependent oxidoreductase (luciferase family)